MISGNPSYPDPRVVLNMISRIASVGTLREVKESVHGAEVGTAAEISTWALSEVQESV